MSLSGRLLIIGLGNPDRGDDGVGALVIQELGGWHPPGVQLITRSGDPLALLDDWASFNAVICIDAAATEARPGRIHRIDPAIEPLPQPPLPTSSHALGLADTIELARVLGRAPPHLIVYAIEGHCFDSGAPVTPAVAAAATQVALLITTQEWPALARMPPTNG
ncbi:hydrogenase maturation protease [Sinimarinibacterium sp. CAU 1509]|uniref:hydrogenase maturation protease n=1 Tax=Sinimarinibacterium sp. CAU 1509 TaxID=2562283 RepID=UPI00146F67CF|nr:hydrogenase maturation protease [Sinimarinibacterium sp. CAU 1509]